jgi:hypothetical protein
MSNNTKIIYEFYYVVGHEDFASYYKLAVDRETEKMLYGNALNNEGNVYGRFAIKKSNLNEVQEIIDRKYGIVYKIQIDEANEQQARLEAYHIISNHLCNIAEQFCRFQREKWQSVRN